MKKLITLLSNKSFAAILSKVMSAALTFVFLFLVARSTSTEEAGIFLYSYSVMMTLVQLSRAGTDNAIIKQLAHKKSASLHRILIRKTSFFVILIAATISTVMIVITNLGFLPVYQQETALFVLYVFLVVTVLFSVTQVIASYFQSQVMVYSQYWSLGIGVSFSGCLACLLTYFQGVGVLHLSIYFLCFCLLFLASCYLLYFRALKFLSLEKLNEPTNLLNFKSTLKFIAPFSLIAFIMIIIQQGGALLSGFWLTESELALTSISFRLSTLVGFLFVAFSALLAPRISAQYEQKNIIDIHDKSLKQVGLSNAFSLCMFLFFITFGEFVLVLFGDEYRGGYIPLLIFSSCWVLRSLAGPVGTVLTMTNNLKALRINLYISALVILISSLLLIPNFGVIGAAISSLLGTGVMCVLNAIKVKRQLNITFCSLKSFHQQALCVSSLISKRTATHNL